MRDGKYKDFVKIFVSLSFPIGQSLKQTYTQFHFL